MKKLIAIFLLSIASLCSAAPKELPDGSLLLSPKDVEELQLLINKALQEAAAAGAREALDVLKSNPKLCPRNI